MNNEDTNKLSNLDILNTKCNFKILELEGLNLDDDWSKLSKVKNLETLILKDSYIDFKKFYNAIFSLKKLNKLKLNHYCYFNKSKNDKFEKNLKLSSLKEFCLEFPRSDEPDFEINTYLHKSYKNKHNSITDVPNSHTMFPNLEVIKLLNYETYKKRILDENEDEDNKKIHKEIYWNTKLNDLKRFKKLKNIVIDNGNVSDLYINGLDHFIKILEKQKINLTINNINNTSKLNLDFKTVNFFCGYKGDKTNLCFKLDNEFLNILKENNIIIDKNVFNINEFHYYKEPYKYDKPYVINKNKNYEEVIKSNPTCFIFKSCFRFLHISNSGSSRGQKLDAMEHLFKNQNKLEKIIFDLSRNDKYDGDEDWHANQISFLVKFIYEFRLNNKDTQIFIYHPEIKKLLNEKDSSDSFKIHLIYLYNSLKINNLKDKLTILGANDEQLDLLTDKFINENVNQVVVIDDIFYNKSSYFPDKTFINNDQLDDLKSHYPKYINDDDKKWSKLNHLFKYVYEEIIRIIDFSDSDFKPDKNSLILVIKKTAIDKIPNINLKKIYIYSGASLHHVAQQMNHTEKNWNAKKIVGKLVNNNEEGINKIKDKLFSVATNISESFVSSNDFKGSNLSKEDFLKPAEFNEIVENTNIKHEKIKSLTHCWIEGVNPWQEKYIKLSEFDKFIPIDNLEYLKLSDCLQSENLDLPHFPKLKILKIKFFQNHHRKSLDKVTLSKFDNCPNLQKIEISDLENFYNKGLFKHTLGFSGYSTNLHYIDTWSYINVDLSKLHQLKKLEQVTITSITASDLKELKSVENLKKINLGVMHFNKDDYKSTYEPQKEICDQDLSFFKNCKKIEDINLRLGDPNYKGESFGNISSSYKGNGEFINFINHKIKKLKLNVNLDIKNQATIQDIINNITNRFLSLEELNLSFSIAARAKYFDSEKGYTQKIDTQIIDFKKIAKLKKLKNLNIQHYGESLYIPFKSVNFDEVIKLKLIKDLAIMWNSVSFSEFRKARIAFKKEKYDNPIYYDEYIEDYEEDSDYRKNWNRMEHINTEDWDFYSLESKYLDLEKRENKKKYEKKLIIKKKNS